MIAAPTNAPVVDASGAVIYIIHRVEDVTEFLRVKRREWVRYHSTVSRWETEQYLTLF